jgi:hypothetical protein
MARKNLTEAMVARIKAPAAGKQKDYLDALLPGLILRVNFGGKKVWRVRHYLKRTDEHGRRLSIPTTHALGAYPVLKVKEAREKARQFLADPRKALVQADVGSFREVAENFLKRHVEASGLRSQKEIERLLKKHVVPAWGERPFREITATTWPPCSIRSRTSTGRARPTTAWRSFANAPTGTPPAATTTPARW